jgi:riboflavin biosynthesis pyrimidine reductase
MPSPQQWSDRFDAWSEEKTRQAIAAALPPYVTELAVPDADARPIGNPWTERLFDGPWYVSAPRDPDRPACSLVFVQSADGNTGAHDPATLGGGQTDKHLIYEGLSRVAADGVLAGAATVRGSGVIFSVWHPELIRLRRSLALPRHPVQIVATLRGMDLDEELIFNVPDVEVVLLTTRAASDEMRAGLLARPWVTPVLLHEPADLRGGVKQLVSRGIRRVSCVGGRTLACSLLDANLVDEIYLTTAARPGGEPGTPLCGSPWRGPTRVRKRGTAEETGVLFEQIVPLRATA